WWRYATFADLVNLVQAATFGSLALVLVQFIPGHRAVLPGSILLVDWALVVLLLCGSRAASRLGRELGWRRPRKPARMQKRVLVGGAGEAGEAVARKIGVSSRLGMRVVGFLDDDPRAHGRTLAGRPVLGALDDVQRIAQRSRAACVLVSAQALPAR